ncbi:hypothetical protein RB195_023425 [Necator americanus]|uniref:Uncharacterized protein n=1 Tax=Necator americanus TaxID=51031 RepID=A0ABR1EK15_NECAM
MTPKYALEAVDGLLRDIMQNDRPLDGLKRRFGTILQHEKTMVLAYAEAAEHSFFVSLFLLDARLLLSDTQEKHSWCEENESDAQIPKLRLDRIINSTALKDT